MSRLLLTAFFLLFSVAAPTQSTSAQSTEAQSTEAEADLTELKETCEHLIAAVANSGLTFIRNGNRAASEKAAAHIRRKYDHFQDQITTPEEFIELTATRSLMTGKAYEVILADGKRMPLKDWLLDILRQYRDGSPSSS